MDKAVILAGGYGTRLAPITQTLPKPLVQVLEKSVLEHILDNLQNLGIREVVMSTMYLREKIIDKIGNRYKDINIGYENEEIPIGTAGGAKTAALKLNLREDENFLIVSGDGIFDFDLRGAVSFHESKSALATIVTYSHPKPLDYGIILSDKDGRIKRFIEKPN